VIENKFTIRALLFPSFFLGLIFIYMGTIKELGIVAILLGPFSKTETFYIHF
jgi:hypothetical protein